VARLGDCCQIVSGATPKRNNPEYWGDDVPWVTPKDLSNLGQKVLDDAPEYISEEGYRSCSAKLMPAGSVLFSSRAPIGLVAIAGREMCTNQGFKSLVPGPEVNSDYLYYWLKGNRDSIAEKGNGATFKEVSASIMRDIKIPLPPLAEQKRIAKILDAADALRAKRRESLAQLHALLQSTFLEMFGDPVENPRGWEKRTLGNVACQKPNNGIFRKKPEYLDRANTDAGLPVVWVEELFRGNSIDVSASRRLEATAGEIDKYGLNTGDILFCRSSLKLDGIAYCSVYGGDEGGALFECHLIRLSPDRDLIDPMFLNMQLRTTAMRAVLKSKSKTSTMTTIDQKALSSVEVVVPPVEEQKRFSSIVAEAEKQKGLFQKQDRELQSLFGSLQVRAFSGEL
jgi:type I restriction enzyme S subunit